MNILIDTNIVISLEPTAPEHLEPRTATAAGLVRVASEGAHRLLLHPESLRELAHDTDQRRRDLREVLVGKYERLDPAPPMADDVVAVCGSPDPASHDFVDHLMLSAVVANAATFLVTDDGGIHRKAVPLGLSDRVLTAEDALAFLASLLGRSPEPPPLVVRTKVYELTVADPIFDSFRADYSSFDDWFARCQLEHRSAWVIREGDALAAVCIIKEDDDEVHLGGRTLKIASLKVSEQRQGRRYGELLLKTVFGYLAENGYSYAFLTVFEHHAELISLLDAFGFIRKEPDKETGERYYVKTLVRASGETEDLPPLEFHVRFGPPAVRLVPGGVFLVPIQPQFHRLLFPDAERQEPAAEQLELALEGLEPRELPQPFGNALRKAYLSNTPTRLVDVGATLLFYRSRDERAVTCVGVVEDTLVSSDANQVATFVGQRTVYSLDEIQAMCRAGEVVALLFRQDRLLDPTISFDEVQAQGIARGAPRSIQRVPEEVIEWLATRIDA